MWRSAAADVRSNALAALGIRPGEAWRDPHCPAYYRLFKAVSEPELAEVFAPANLAEIVARPDPVRGLLRRGPMLRLLNGDARPRPDGGASGSLKG